MNLTFYTKACYITADAVRSNAQVSEELISSSVKSEWEETGDITSTVTEDDGSVTTTRISIQEREVEFVFRVVSTSDVSIKVTGVYNFTDNCGTISTFIVSRWLALVDVDVSIKVETGWETRRVKSVVVTLPPEGDSDVEPLPEDPDSQTLHNGHSKPPDRITFGRCRPEDVKRVEEWKDSWEAYATYLTQERGYIVTVDFERYSTSTYSTSCPDGGYRSPGGFRVIFGDRKSVV